MCFGIFEGMGPAANYSIIYGTFASRHTHTTQLKCTMLGRQPACQTDRWRAGRRTKKTDSRRTDNHAPTFVHRACIMNTPCVYVPPHSTPRPPQKSRPKNRKPQTPYSIFHTTYPFSVETSTNQAKQFHQLPSGECRLSQMSGIKI